MNQEQRQILWASSLASFLTAFMTSSVNLALPRIADSFLSGAKIVICRVFLKQLYSLFCSRG